MPLLDLVQAKTKDDSGRLTESDDYLPAIAAALARYSRHNPKESVADLEGDGSRELALPAGWIDELSTVVKVEYPLGENPPALLGLDEWMIYRTPSATVLRLAQETPEAAEFVRLTFTTSRAEADVPAEDLDAVACLAAASCLQTLASIFLQTSDPTISADVVNYRSKSGEAAARARDLRKQYNEHVGSASDGGAPAGAVTAPPPANGRTRLTH